MPRVLHQFFTLLFNNMKFTVNGLFLAIMLMFAISMKASDVDESIFVEDDIDDGEASADDQRALVLLRKKIEGANGDRYLVEGLTFSVEYAVFNVGEVGATDVTVSDTWPEAVSVIDGSFPIIVEELAPGASYMSNITFKAEKSGPFPTSDATVTYSYDDETSTGTFSNAQPILSILSFEEFDSLTNSHSKEWTTAGALAAGPIIIPAIVFLLLARSNAVNSVPSKKKNR